MGSENFRKKDVKLCYVLSLDIVSYFQFNNI